MADPAAQYQAYAAYAAAAAAAGSAPTAQPTDPAHAAYYQQYYAHYQQQQQYQQYYAAQAAAAAAAAASAGGVAAPTAPAPVVAEPTYSAPAEATTTVASPTPAAGEQPTTAAAPQQEESADATAATTTSGGEATEEQQQQQQEAAAPAAPAPPTAANKAIPNPQEHLAVFRELANQAVAALCDHTNTPSPYWAGKARAEMPTSFADIALRVPTYEAHAYHISSRVGPTNRLAINLELATEAAVCELLELVVQVALRAIKVPIYSVQFVKRSGGGGGAPAVVVQTILDFGSSTTAAPTLMTNLKRYLGEGNIMLVTPSSLLGGKDPQTTFFVKDFLVDTIIDEMVTEKREELNNAARDEHLQQQAEGGEATTEPPTAIDRKTAAEHVKLRGVTAAASSLHGSGVSPASDASSSISSETIGVTPKDLLPLINGPTLITANRWASLGSPQGTASAAAMKAVAGLTHVDAHPTDDGVYYVTVKRADMTWQWFWTFPELVQRLQGQLLFKFGILFCLAMCDATFEESGSNNGANANGASEASLQTSGPQQQGANGPAASDNTAATSSSATADQSPTANDDDDPLAALYHNDIVKQQVVVERADAINAAQQRITAMQQQQQGGGNRYYQGGAPIPPSYNNSNVSGTSAYDAVALDNTTPAVAPPPTASTASSASSGAFANALSNASYAAAAVASAPTNTITALFHGGIEAMTNNLNNAANANSAAAAYLGGATAATTTAAAPSSSSLMATVADDDDDMYPAIEAVQPMAAPSAAHHNAAMGSGRVGVTYGVLGGASSITAPAANPSLASLATSGTAGRGFVRLPMATSATTSTAADDDDDEGFVEERPEEASDEATTNANNTVAGGAQPAAAAGATTAAAARRHMTGMEALQAATTKATPAGGFRIFIPTAASKRPREEGEEGSNHPPLLPTPTGNVAAPAAASLPTVGGFSVGFIGGSGNMTTAPPVPLQQQQAPPRTNIPVLPTPPQTFIGATSANNNGILGSTPAMGVLPTPMPANNNSAGANILPNLFGSQQQQYGQQHQQPAVLGNPPPQLYPSVIAPQMMGGGGGRPPIANLPPATTMSVLGNQPLEAFMDNIKQQYKRYYNTSNNAVNSAVAGGAIAKLAAEFVLGRDIFCSHRGTTRVLHNYYTNEAFIDRDVMKTIAANPRLRWWMDVAVGPNGYKPAANAGEVAKLSSCLPSLLPAGNGGDMTPLEEIIFITRLRRGQAKALQTDDSNTHPSGDDTADAPQWWKLTQKWGITRTDEAAAYAQGRVFGPNASSSANGKCSSPPSPPNEEEDDADNATPKPSTRKDVFAAYPYPAVGTPCPPINPADESSWKPHMADPHRMSEHVSTKYGLHYFTYVPAASADKSKKSAYKHPITRREYVATPQSFLADAIASATATTAPNPNAPAKEKDEPKHISEEPIACFAARVVATVKSLEGGKNKPTYVANAVKVLVERHYADLLRLLMCFLRYYYLKLWYAVHPEAVAITPYPDGSATNVTSPANSPHPRYVKTNEWVLELLEHAASPDSPYKMSSPMPTLVDVALWFVDQNYRVDAIDELVVAVFGVKYPTNLKRE